MTKLCFFVFLSFISAYFFFLFTIFLLISFINFHLVMILFVYYFKLFNITLFWYHLIIIMVVWVEILIRSPSVFGKQIPWLLKWLLHCIFSWDCRCDIIIHGVYNSIYVKQSSISIICSIFRINNESLSVWQKPAYFIIVCWNLRLISWFTVILHLRLQLV